MFPGSPGIWKHPQLHRRTSNIWSSHIKSVKPVLQRSLFASLTFGRSSLPFGVKASLPEDALIATKDEQQVPKIAQSCDQLPCKISTKHNLGWGSGLL